MNWSKAVQSRRRKKEVSKKLGKFSLRNIFLSIGFTLIVGCFGWLQQELTDARLPTADQPAELYANQTRDDLRQTIVGGIDQAKESVLFIIYALTDKGIITSLRRKSDEGIPVKVICDAKASPGIVKNLGPKVDLVRRYSTGFMHQKILVVDGRQVWIGSANMTQDSLRLHANLITAMECPALASMITQKASTVTEDSFGPPMKHREFQIGGQKVEFWLFPDDSQGVNRLKQLIESAQKTVRVAMFAWTRNDLAQAVIAAKQRGVKTEVIIDSKNGKGFGAKIVKLLREEGVSIGLSRVAGNGLLHHKFLYIDGHTLVNGSANWTQRAFNLNNDCFLILHNLTEKQKKHMEKLWEVIVAESIPVR